MLSPSPSPLATALAASSLAAAEHWQPRWTSPPAPPSLLSMTMPSALSSLHPQPMTMTRTLARQWRLEACKLGVSQLVPVKPPQPPRCCHRAAAVVLAATAALHAAATTADAAAAAAPPPSFHQHCAGALRPPPTSRCRAAAIAADVATVVTPPPSCRQRCAVVLPPPPQPPHCYHRAAAVALCTAAMLCAAATAADAATNQGSGKYKEILD